MATTSLTTAIPSLLRLILSTMRFHCLDAYPSDHVIPQLVLRRDRSGAGCEVSIKQEQTPYVLILIPAPIIRRDEIAVFRPAREQSPRGSTAAKVRTPWNGANRSGTVGGLGAASRPHPGAAMASSVEVCSFAGGAARRSLGPHRSRSGTVKTDGLRPRVVSHAGTSGV